MPTSRHASWLIAAWAALAAVTSFAQTPGKGLGETVERGPDRVAPPAPAPAETILPAGDSIEEIVASLTLEQRVAQLMFVTLTGRLGPDNNERQLLHNLTPGGVVVPQAEGPLEGLQYLAAVRATAGEATRKIPLFLAANVYTLTQHAAPKERRFVQLPTPLSLAAANEPESTGRIVALVGRYLGTMGFNMNIGPSLELAATLPESPGSLQLFGSDPELTGALGSAFVSGLAAQGIVSLPTGFPGGGANRLATGPAVLLTPRPLMAGSDLLPYARAIAAGARLMHVGNTLVPTLDKEAEIASLSPVAIREILRGEMGFEGVVVAGPLDARDVATKFDPGEAAVRALEAGADMLFWMQANVKVLKAISAVTVAAERGDLDPALVDAALRRTLELKRELGLLERAVPEEKAARALEQEIPKMDDSYAVERRSITLVQNNAGVLPLLKDLSAPIGVTGVTGVEELHDALEEHIDDIAQQPIATARHIGRIQDFEIDRITRSARGMKTIVCIFDAGAKPEGQAKLVSELQAAGARAVVVLLGYPSTLPRFAGADAIVLAYSGTETLAQTMRAVADVLVGGAPVGILPAVRDLERAPGEPIAFNALDVVRCPVGRLPAGFDAPFVAGMSVSYSPALALDKAAWDFGDGKTSNEFEAVHAYAAAGRYPVTLTLTDKTGEVVSSTFHVNVK